MWLIVTGSRKKALTYEAERLMRGKRYPQALDYYDAIAGEWPDDPLGFQGIASVYETRGMAADAERMNNIAACLLEAAENNSEPQVQLKVADSFVAARLYNLALNYAEKALRLAPNDLAVLKRGALIFRHNRQYGKALAAVKQALRFSPLDESLYEQMAINLKGLERKDDARRAFSLSRALAKVRQNPSDSQAVESVIFHFTMAGARN
jgi:tetratricopeptide (TPR) repeat protein